MIFLDYYYNTLEVTNGWNDASAGTKYKYAEAVETGIPSKAFLEEIGGLECVIKDLYGKDL